MKSLIGICGPKGSGKSSVAWILHRDHEYTRYPFASTLKRMLRTFGLTEAQVDGDEKEWPLDWLGDVTPRHLMQTLGTEWGRDRVASDVWVRTWERDVRVFGPLVVVEDVRFPNEVEAIHELGGWIVRVTRPGFSHDESHESERHVIEADFEIRNDGDRIALAESVRKIVPMVT